MPRPKAKKWELAGLHDNPVPSLYPDGVLDEIIGKHLRIDSDQGREKARRLMRDILGVLWLGLHYRSRPTGGSKISALKAAESTLEKAHKLVMALDADSRRLIEAEAGKDSALQEFFPAIFEDDMGDARYAFALDVVSALCRWIEKAKAIQPSDRGRMRQADEETAIVRCRNLMTSALHREPSRDELLSFVDELFAPFRTKLGLLDSPMTGHVNQALYGL
jgi:hypothetical protein